MDVLFCNAVASAKESKLLDAEKLSRMADCVKLTDALKICAEVGFGGDAVDFAAACAREEELLAALIRDYSPTENIRAFLTADYDFHNAEAVVKAKHTGLDETLLLAPNGMFDAAQMKEDAMKDAYVGYPKKLREALVSAEAAFMTETDGRTVGAIFAKAKFAYKRQFAVGILKKIWQFEVDAVNIQTCARSENFAAAQSMLIDGGTVTEQDLKKVGESTPDVVNAAFKTTPYQEYVTAILEADNGALVRAERIRADQAVALLSENRFEARGAEPYLLYVYYKRAEIANVRIVAAGINNGLERAEITARLRDGYGN